MLLGSAGQQDDEILSVAAVADAVAGASVDPQLEYAPADSAVVPETAQLDTVETRRDTGADAGALEPEPRIERVRAVRRDVADNPDHPVNCVAIWLR